MRRGLVARADRTGLGAQTWAFWKHMRPAATLLVDLSRHSRQRPDRFMYAGDPNVRVWDDGCYPDVTPRPDPVVDEFLDRVDVVFSAETFYNTYLLVEARRRGIRTVLQPNYEFLDYLLYPGMPEPDVFALPSTWHLEDIKRALPGRDIRYLPVPVDRELLPHRRRTKLRTVLHTAGTPAMEDRNGTMLVIEAMRHVTSPVSALIRTQKPLPVHRSQLPRNVRIDSSPVPRFADLYGAEDLYVMPRKFGGLCLPMAEALSVGMPVLASDVSPQNGFLPADLLVPAPEVKEIMTRAPIKVHEANPVDLAERIDWLYDHPERFEALSVWTDRWASNHSWEALKPAYDEVLAG